MRVMRLRKRLAPSMPSKPVQSISFSMGAAKIMKRRRASAPYFEMTSSGSTMLPLDLLIFEPSFSTMPWQMSFWKGSGPLARPKSRSTL